MRKALSKMYSDEVQQGLWHCFLRPMKVLIPGFSKKLSDTCFKENIFAPWHFMDVTF